MSSQERWGCNAVSKVTETGETVWEDDGAADMPVELGEAPNIEEWWRCPRRPVKDDPRFFTELARLWHMREKGFLPYPGSYFEQPHLFVEAMEVMDSAIAEVDRMNDKRRPSSGE